MKNTILLAVMLNTALLLTACEKAAEIAVEAKDIAKDVSETAVNATKHVVTKAADVQMKPLLMP